MTKLFSEEDDGLPDNIDPVTYVREKFNMAADAPVDPVLAKSKLESDQFIKMKNRQFDQLSESYLKLKADYEARAKLEELIDKLPSQDNRELPDANNKPGYDPEELERIFDKKLSSYERKQREEANVKRAKELAREKLGNKWSNTLKEKMDELELSEEETYALMAKSPKAFANTFGLETKPLSQPFQAPPSSSYKSEFKPTAQGQDRTWSYYQDLREKNPKAWLDPKIQTQMYHDAQRLGAAFADGDFNAYNERIS